MNEVLQLLPILYGRKSRKSNKIPLCKKGDTGGFKEYPLLKKGIGGFKKIPLGEGGFRRIEKISVSSVSPCEKHPRS